MFLVYGGNMELELKFSCYTDAGYLIDADDLKSETGYVFVLNGGVVNWKSTKQSICATSSTDVEYIAAFDASKEAIWIHKFIYGLGIVPTIEEPISMYCDNTEAIAIAKDNEVTKGARYFRVKVHYLRETIKLGDVKIEKVDTYDSLADPFTKALAFPKHSELTRNIGMLPTSSFIVAFHAINARRIPLAPFIYTLVRPSDKLNYLEQHIPPASVAPAGQQVAPEIFAAHNAWIKGSKEIDGLMLMTMEPEIQQNIELLHAYEMLRELKTLMGKTVNELHAMLKLYEQILPKNNAPALNAIRAGHWKRNCPQYLAELLKKKKNAAFGAGGSAVEANGAFYLCIPGGLEIVLNNCHYVPSITRGVISVSCLYEYGFVNRFVDNTIQVSMNNMVYFSAIPRDGIFEIDLSNSLINESSIYAVSNKRAKLDLDSSLLWHCRLGHISKKHIKKLQHDGLLDSSDLRAFEKCVFCMSKKMARIPYTHQVERAKDLLGLIHTYVCGPFKIMSRQGANYFITFIDDFSHYDYVYLLKHKHELFETFKVFQMEVENQLASGSLEDLEIIQKEDTHPSIDTSLNHEEDGLQIDEPQSDIVPIRRSTRTRHAPDRMCLYIDVEEHELGDLGEPTNYKAALLDLESKKWFNAMNVEMQSMKENEV
nr:retrotransposon protein, putative, Ty1-copia subclass [Tanacetum cinerariifolium]